MTKKKISQKMIGTVGTLYGDIIFEFEVNLNSRTPTTCYKKIKAMFIKLRGLSAWNSDVYDVSFRVNNEN